MSREFRALNRRERARQTQAPPTRRSIFDPVVLAAIVGLLSGTGIKIADELGESDRVRIESVAQAEKARCERAYGYLQDDTLHTKSQQDDEFYQMNRNAAMKCVRGERFPRSRGTAKSEE